MNQLISVFVNCLIQAKAELVKLIPFTLMAMLNFPRDLSLQGTKRSRIFILILVAVTLITYSGCNNSAALKVEHITAFDTVIKTTFKGNAFSTKFVNYKLFNYNDDAKTQQKILAYLKKDIDKNLSSYHDYTISIYPAEDESDKIMLRDHPSRFYNLENLLYSFWWIDGKLVWKKKYKDGEVIDPENDVLIRSM